MTLCSNLVVYKTYEIVDKVLLAGHKFMPEMHLIQPGFIYSACGPFTKNKELKNLCRQEIQISVTRMILIKLVFNMIWLTVNIEIWLKEYNLIKFKEIKLLKLQVIQTMMVIKED